MKEAEQPVTPIPKEPKPRSSGKFSLRPTVNVRKNWDYKEQTEAIKDPNENSDTSSTSTTSSKRQAKFYRPKDLDGDALRIWTVEKYEQMDKQFKFESKDTLICSKLECRGELKEENSFSFCHGYPFHNKCLREKVLIKDGVRNSIFKCDDCEFQRCFICKKENEIGEMPPKCSKCDLRFHRDCLIFKWPQADVIGSDGSITCPLHFCHICKAEHFHFDKVRNYELPPAKGIKCIHCLASYHKGTCIPAGTGNSIMQNQFLICPRHASHVPKKRKLGCFGCYKKLTSKDDTVSCSLCPLKFHANCVHGENHLKAGISLEEFRNTFKCEGCHWGTFPLYGQVVWYQQPGSTYWPSIVLYPKDATARGATAVGQFSVSYCNSPLYFDKGRSNYSIPLEIGNKDFLKKLNLYSNSKVTIAAKEAYHLIKLSDGNRDSNLPPPKPIYKKIEKNLYRIPASQISITSKGKRMSSKNKKSEDDEICQCGQDLAAEKVCGPGSGCFNIISAIECSEDNCSGKERCQNRMFSTKRTDQNEPLLEYFISPGSKGWGLKTKCNFSEGAFICEYVGEMISKEEKAWRVERKCDEDPIYFFEINTTTFIDAEYYGNVSRLINHSCDPNCETEKYQNAHGKPVVGIFAKRDIEKGDELTFDYNFGSKSSLAFKCRCKSKSCKGLIGGSRGNEENLAPNKKKKSQIQKDSDWKWEDECSVCGCRGELLMCDFDDCSKAYHLNCLGFDTTPKGVWHCPQHDSGLSKQADSIAKPPPTKKSKLSTRVP